MTGIIPATSPSARGRGKALDHGRARDRNLSLFEHDDREGRKSFEQLTRAKQEIGTARRAEASVAAREGPVGQRTPPP